MWEENIKKKQIKLKIENPIDQHMGSSYKIIEVIICIAELNIGHG